MQGWLPAANLLPLSGKGIYLETGDEEALVPYYCEQKQMKTAKLLKYGGGVREGTVAVRFIPPLLICVNKEHFLWSE